jgi:hypothetical protein
MCIAQAACVLEVGAEPVRHPLRRSLCGALCVNRRFS